MFETVARTKHNFAPNGNRQIVVSQQTDLRLRVPVWGNLYVRTRQLVRNKTPSEQRASSGPAIHLFVLGGAEGRKAEGDGNSKPVGPGGSADMHGRKGWAAAPLPPHFQFRALPLSLLFWVISRTKSNQWIRCLFHNRCPPFDII